VIEYELGQAIRISMAFLDGNGAAADPTTITVKYGPQTVNPPPDPTATTVTFPATGFVKDAVGLYHYDFVPSVPANYVYTGIGTGTVAAVARGYFRVKPSPFA
jgi:hypothetical protein